jgi:hypothetical protein
MNSYHYLVETLFLSIPHWLPQWRSQSGVFRVSES